MQARESPRFSSKLHMYLTHVKQENKLRMHIYVYTTEQVATTLTYVITYA